MNMIERVARALADGMADMGINAETEIPDGDGCVEPLWKSFVPAARAAIQAMEIPSAEMINAGINCDDWADGEQDATKLIASTFSAMIKEAIK